MTKERWSRMVEKMNGRIQKDAQAMAFIKENEQLVYSDRILSDYPIAEFLPFFESPFAFEEELHYSHRRVTRKDPIDTDSLYTLVDSLLKGSIKLGLSFVELKTIHFYWVDRESVEVICKRLNLVEEEVNKTLGKIVSILRSVTKEQLQYCGICGRYYVGNSHGCEAVEGGR